MRLNYPNPKNNKTPFDGNIQRGTRRGEADMAMDETIRLGAGIPFAPIR